MKSNFTVVTNCNRNYLWGAYLLTASLRFENNPAAIHVIAYDFTPEEVKLLEQFDNVRVVKPENSNPRNPTNLKPLALLTAETEYIGWFDSDTMVIGDITKYWIPPNGSFQSRFRQAPEMYSLYRTKYEPGEETGGVPKKILEIWRRDVGENDRPAIKTTCTADNFVFHRRHLDFIKRWYEQLNKVIPAEDQGVVNKTSFAYRQTDEEILNSLMAFSQCAPPVDGQYLLDKDPNAFVLHFGMLPKPWQGWQHRFLPYYENVLGVVEWAQQKGYATPPVPPALQRRYKGKFRLKAMRDQTIAGAKNIARRILRK